MCIYMYIIIYTLLYIYIYIYINVNQCEYQCELYDKYFSKKDRSRNVGNDCFLYFLTIFFIDISLLT